MSQLVKTGSVLPHVDFPTHHKVHIDMQEVISHTDTGFKKVTATKAEVKNFSEYDSN